MKRAFLFSLALHLTIFTLALTTNFSTRKKIASQPMHIVDLVDAKAVSQKVSKEVKGITAPANRKRNEKQKAKKSRVGRKKNISEKKRVEEQEKKRKYLDELLQKQKEEEEKQKEARVKERERLIAWRKEAEGKNNVQTVLSGEKTKIPGWYIDSIHNTVFSNWDPPPISSTPKVVIVFSVKRDGRISNIVVKRTSENNIYDESALRAIRVSSPLLPLPSSVSNREIRVNITFHRTES